MSDSERNVAKLKEAYRLWHETKAGSVDQWIELMDDMVKFRSLAEGGTGMEFSKNRSSKEEVRGYMSDLTADWSMDHYTTHQFIAQDDWVAVLRRCGWTSKRTGKSIDSPKADFFRFENGKIVAFYEFYNTAMAFEAAS